MFSPWFFHETVPESPPQKRGAPYQRRELLLAFGANFCLEVTNFSAYQAIVIKNQVQFQDIRENPTGTAFAQATCNQP